MQSDIEISRSISPKPIAEIAKRLGLDSSDWQPYGEHIAKIENSVLASKPKSSSPKLILVSAITPTPAGEGKTTTSIGLAQGLAKLGESVCLALREPSLGPCMGIKGGATGGGYSQVYPMERINLHFTGDFHAITSAHNLLSAALDNHVHFDNQLGLDPRRTIWKRVMDMNDRSLRNVTIGLGGPLQGIPRETGFDITAASEIMAILCLAETEADLRERIDRILIGFTRAKEPVEARGLNVTGAMLALLQDAMKPNLVQTLEGVPALIHGGPFANIAHGCNSVLATKTALHLADWAITEAGFGFDLGAEKFFDIKCRSASLEPAAIVLVATVRALKMHGGKAQTDLTSPDAEAVSKGLPNLEKHIESTKAFGKPAVVALNRFGSDMDEEIDVIRKRCEELGVAFALTEHHARGGEGAVELAKTLVATEKTGGQPFEPLYQLGAPIIEKIESVARKVYGADGVIVTKQAEKDLKEVDRLGYGELPVCIAKTQNSLSDDPTLRGRPRDFRITVRGLEINAGAGFIVALTGDIFRMPGLPRKPRAEEIDLRDGKIEGLQ
jgi:formate--tetrahydrofolate ligase